MLGGNELYFLLQVVEKSCVEIENFRVFLHNSCVWQIDVIAF